LCIHHILLIQASAQRSNSADHTSAIHTTQQKSHSLSIRDSLAGVGCNELLDLAFTVIFDLDSRCFHYHATALLFNYTNLTLELTRAEHEAFNIIAADNDEREAIEASG
jgi:hypothetical protein